MLKLSLLSKRRHLTEHFRYSAETSGNPNLVVRIISQIKEYTLGLRNLNFLPGKNSQYPYREDRKTQIPCKLSFAMLIIKSKIMGHMRETENRELKIIQSSNQQTKILELQSYLSSLYLYFFSLYLSLLSVCTSISIFIILC